MLVTSWAAAATATPSELPVLQPILASTATTSKHPAFLLSPLSNLPPHQPATMLRTQVVKLARATPYFQRSFSAAAIRAAEGDTGGVRSGGVASGYPSLSTRHYLNGLSGRALTRCPTVIRGPSESKPARQSSSERRKWKRASISFIIHNYLPPVKPRIDRSSPSSLKKLREKLHQQRKHLDELDQHIKDLESERGGEQ